MKRVFSARSPLLDRSITAWLHQSPALFQSLVRLLIGTGAGALTLFGLANFTASPTPTAPDMLLRLRAALPNADFIKVETQPSGPYVSQLIERSAGRLKALAGCRRADAGCTAPASVSDRAVLV